jgi:hypothetical protein
MMRNPNTPPQFIVGEPYLRGPIPLAWLNAAGRLPGKALHVGLYCWYLAHLSRSMTFRLSTSKLNEIGVGRQAAYRALADLEHRKLLLVERHRGRCPVVTLSAHPAGVVNQDTNMSCYATPA